MSQTRRRYFIRLVVRCIIFVLCVGLCITRPERFGVLDGWNFTGCTDSNRTGGVGSLHHDLSGAVLGDDQCGA